MPDPLFSPAADAAIASSASKATLAGGATATAVGFFQGIDWMGLGGLMIAIAGGLISLYFKSRQDKRNQILLAGQEEERKARMRRDDLEAQLRRQLLEREIAGRVGVDQ